MRKCNSACASSKGQVLSWTSGCPAARAELYSTPVRSNTWPETTGFYLCELQLLLGLQGRHLNCGEFCCSTLKKLLAVSAWCIYWRLLTSQQNWHNGTDTSHTSRVMSFLKTALFTILRWGLSRPCFLPHLICRSIGAVCENMPEPPGS